MYRGYWKNKNITINDVNGVDYASAAYYGDMVFLYFESESDTISPNDIVNSGLKSFPDGRIWENMSEIFHYSTPLSKEHWKRKGNKTPYWSFNLIKPECVSKYIYFHFQYQEEYPGDGDRYGIIFNIENIIIMYTELPSTPETEKLTGMLTSKNSPLDDDWGALMNTLFKPHENGKTNWIRMEVSK